jgi:hypothetical protein
MLTGTPLVKDTQKRNFKIENNTFDIFEELASLNSVPGALFSIFHI